MQIRPITFFYNETSPFTYVGDHPMVGVIAQEIKEVLPSTISVKKTEYYDDLLQYDSSELLYTLINEVKELNEKVENLERENKQLHINLIDLRMQLNQKNP